MIVRWTECKHSQLCENSGKRSKELKSLPVSRLTPPKSLAWLLQQDIQHTAIYVMWYKAKQSRQQSTQQRNVCSLCRYQYIPPNTLVYTPPPTPPQHTGCEAPPPPLWGQCTCQEAHMNSQSCSLVSTPPVIVKKKAHSTHTSRVQQITPTRSKNTNMRKNHTQHTTVCNSMY